MPNINQNGVAEQQQRAAVDYDLTAQRSAGLSNLSNADIAYRYLTPNINNNNADRYTAPLYQPAVYHPEQQYPYQADTIYQADIRNAVTGATTPYQPNTTTYLQPDSRFTTLHIEYLSDKELADIRLASLQKALEFYRDVQQASGATRADVVDTAAKFAKFVLEGKNG